MAEIAKNVNFWCGRSAKTFVRSWLAPEGVNIVKFGANHWNDILYGIFSGLFYEGEHIQNKELQLEGAIDLIYPALRDNLLFENCRRFLTIQVTRNGDNRIMTLEEVVVEVDGIISCGIKVVIGGDDEFTAPNISFKDLKQKLETQTQLNIDELIKYPNKVINQLVYQRTAPAVPIEIDPKTERGIPKIEKRPCPGNYDFVSIFSGTTYHFFDAKDEIADTATTVLTDGMFAATVVDGCGSAALSHNSRVYSALITAAALYTVKHGIKENGLTGEKLQDYFFDLIKISDKDAKFIGNKGQLENRGVTFGGAVLYLDAEGKQKKFTYGLGDTAVAATTDEETKTLHLQGDFAHTGGIGANLPALGPGYKCVTASHITATISDVGQELKSIQLMTDGCGPAFFDSIITDEENQATVDQPSKLNCRRLPKHGEFNPQALFDLVNPTNNNQRSNTYKHFQDEFNAWVKTNIEPLMIRMELTSYDSYFEFATEKGRQNHIDYCVKQKENILLDHPIFRINELRKEQAAKRQELSEEEYEKWEKSSCVIPALLKKTGLNSLKEFDVLATEEGRTKYLDQYKLHVEEILLQYSIDEIKQLIATQNQKQIQLNKLSAKAKASKGDDMLLLTFDIKKAFNAIKLAEENEKKIINDGMPVQKSKNEIKARESII